MEPNKKARVAVVGAGAFGQNHLRIFRELEDRAELVAVVDPSEARRNDAASRFDCRAAKSIDEVIGEVDAAVVAAPTSEHVALGRRLLEAGIDVLMEKPIASDVAGGRELVEVAARHGRVLQVGHLERFNPAVTALESIATLPLFFEVHRMNVFSPRSLDIDVVLDLMIHDIEIVLALTGRMPEEIRAAGISILSDKVDIANVRLAFPGGCVANLTASRVSTERIRKLRLFQPSQYVSVDYTKQEGVVFTVSPQRQIGFAQLAVTKREPLRLEIEAFLDCVARSTTPVVDGVAATRALEVAMAILVKIEEHARVVEQSLNTL